MVPNEKFITSAFVNWTKSDHLQRFDVTFSVPYDADIHKIPNLVQAAAARHPHILAKPTGPSCDIKQFGDKGIQFSLTYWVVGNNGYGSDVHFLVWDTLKEAGIGLGPLK